MDLGKNQQNHVDYYINILSVSNIPIGNDLKVSKQVGSVTRDDFHTS